MPFTFSRHSIGNFIEPADNNELQQGIETLSHGVWNVMEPVDSAQASDYARGDGTTDDSGAFATADANNAGNGVTYAPPTSASYLFSASKTLSHALHPPPGAKLKPASGVTITLNGPLLAGAYQVFDTSLGGSIVLGPGVCETVHAAWWGCAPSASAATNAAAINAAIAAAAGMGSTNTTGVAGRMVVQIESGDYHVNTHISMASGVILRGRGRAITNLHQDTSTDDAIQFDANAYWWQISGLTVTGGRYGIGVLHGVAATYGTLRDLVVQDQVTANLYISDYIEEWAVEGCRFEGGTTTIYNLLKDSPPSGSNDYVAKSAFRSCWFTGAAQNAVYAGAGPSAVGWSNVRFSDCWFLQAGQHGVYSIAGLVNVVFDNCAAEGNGRLGKMNVCTGSISSGSATLTITGAVQGTTTGYANGDTVKVEGAGASGTDLQATASSGGGTTTLTLSATASTTVSGVQITNAIYDDYYFGGTSAGSILMLGTQAGDAHTGDGNLRYAVNNAVGANVVCVEVSGNGTLVPVYDPGLMASLLLCNELALRRPYPGTPGGIGMRTSLPDLTGANGWGAMLVSPLGKNLDVVLDDSAGNGTGAHGLLRRLSIVNGNFRVLEQMGNDGASLVVRRAPLNGVHSIPAGTATPDVSDSDVLQTANTAATTITGFAASDYGTTIYAGQEITLIFGDANTTVQHGTNIFLKSGANFTGAAHQALKLVYTGSVWVEPGGSA